MLPTLALAGALVATVLPPSQAWAAPATRTPSRAIERLAPYQPQTTCSPVAKPGVVSFRTIVLRAYGGTGDYGIVRACNIGGISEHKEGRAWDWKASASNTKQLRQVNSMLAWLLHTDRYGNRDAQARRLGVMYLIWNRRIWSSYRASEGWRHYTGAEAHTDHVHISFSWAGALRRTSYWTGVVSSTLRTPVKARRRHRTWPMLTRLKTFDVPATHVAGIVSRFILRRGHRYLLTATGRYHFGRGVLLADAECSRRANGAWYRQSLAQQLGRYRGVGHLDLQVGRGATNWSARDGHSCDSTHSYRLVYKPAHTGRIIFRMVDSHYADNNGSLRVTIKPLT